MLVFLVFVLVLLVFVLVLPVVAIVILVGDVLDVTLLTVVLLARTVRSSEATTEYLKNILLRYMTSTDPQVGHGVVYASLARSGSCRSPSPCTLPSPPLHGFFRKPSHAVPPWSCRAGAVANGGGHCCRDGAHPHRDFPNPGCSESVGSVWSVGFARKVVSLSTRASSPPRL